MAYQELINGESNGIHRGKINSQTSELYSLKLEASQVLVKGNTVNFTPTLPFDPVTKSYVDELFVGWETVYNPQAIAADVFARGSHTGVQATSTITETSLARFVSTAQITNWNQKEDGIGVKNTAFNKNFGTIVGAVSEGNHTHTKTDIGLGNVDNTADDDKAVSTPQQAEIDLRVPYLNADPIIFNPQLTPPAYYEGKIFYDDATKGLALYTDIPDVTWNLGQETLVRIINKTGATIPNGSAVKPTGVDALSTLPTVALALADTFFNALVAGIATHDIVDNAEGFITVQGRVNDVDLNGYSPGVTLFLSDTIPGGYTITRPLIATQIGGVLVTGANGALQLEIENNVTLPPVFGYIYGVPTYAAISSSYQNFTEYDNEVSINAVVDVTAGTIEVPNSGWYRATASISLLTNSLTSARYVSIQIWDVTDSEEHGVYVVTIARSTEESSRSFSFPTELEAGHEYIVRYKSDEIFTIFTVTNLSFDLESIAIA